MSTHLVYDEDFESEEYAASNVVEFFYKKSKFTVKRRTLQEMLDDAEEARKNSKHQTTYERWLEKNLSANDYERFWTLFNDTKYPGKLSTLNRIINDVEAELQGTGDDEETPKD